MTNQVTPVWLSGLSSSVRKVHPTADIKLEAPDVPGGVWAAVIRVAHAALFVDFDPQIEIAWVATTEGIDEQWELNLETRSFGELEQAVLSYFARTAADPEGIGAAARRQLQRTQEQSVIHHSIRGHSKLIH